MRIIFIKTSGGFAEYIDLDECMTIGDLFSGHMPGCDEVEYLIRVNGQPTPPDYILQSNDRIIIIPLDELASI